MKKTQKRLEEARDQIRHLTEMLSKSHKENAKLAKKLRKMRVELGSDSSDHVIGQLSSAESEIGKKIDERLRGLDSRTGVTKFELKLLDFIPGGKNFFNPVFVIWNILAKMERISTES